MTNFKQIWAIDMKNKKRLLAICPSLDNESGIYIWTREEDGIKYCYVGQSVALLNRNLSHLRGYQHIDLSLKKRGLYDKTLNPTGWSIDFFHCPETQLDEQEQKMIKEYAHMGYQFRYNHSLGGQIDKKGLELQNTNGYRRGVAYGQAKAIKEIKVFFDKYLDFVIKGTPNKIKERKFKEFEEMLKGGENDFTES